MIRAALVLLTLLLGDPPEIPNLPANPTGQQIIDAIDSDAFARDEHYKVRLKIGDGSSVDPTLDVFQKTLGGIEKRLVRFASPPDLRGMGILVENRDTMYVYLPGFDKVRRVGMHARTQNVMGSDFNYDDLGVLRYSHDYDAQLVQTTPAEYLIELSSKPGRDPLYVKLRAWISRKCLQYSKIEYYDSHGMLVRTHLREYREGKGAGKRCLITKTSMIAHNRGNHMTVAEILDVKLNEKLPDDLFTVRSLARGN
jgi:outer membrane lipoprotein-sorting protein